MICTLVRPKIGRVEVGDGGDADVGSRAFHARNDSANRLEVGVHEREVECLRVLREGSRPTAVAVSTLDVCEPATDLGKDVYAHWGLTHFLLDGHHKVQAASEAGAPITLLSLIGLDASLADPEQVDTAVRARGRPVSPRLT